MSHPYLYILSFILLLSGCADGEEHADEVVDPAPPGEMVAVSFSSVIGLATKAGGEAAGVTADTDPVLADDVQVIVYAYKEAAAGIPTAAPVASRTYKAANGNGSLAESGSEGLMYLAVGKYCFYALSVNENSQPPVLAEGSFSETGELTNNTDYIYCKTNATISSASGEEQEVLLSFSRLSVRIELKVVSEINGTDAGKATEAATPVIELAATDPVGSKIRLGADPVITSGRVPDAAVANTGMTVTGTLAGGGFTAGCIMLPMKAGQEIPVTLTFPTITFDGLSQQKDKLYTLAITTPEGGFVSGNQYSYRVNITGNEVVFQGVTVTGWKDKEGSMPDSDITEDFM